MKLSKSLFESESEPIHYPNNRTLLYQIGVQVVTDFCVLNDLPIPNIKAVAKAEWSFGACAYYRKDRIRICLEHCAHPCVESSPRNWSWPGNVTDREPYGVLAHELGHHADWCKGSNKDDYWSEYGDTVATRSSEPPISSYHPNTAEWFAEMFRLFVTNPDLLRLIRPKTYKILSTDFKVLHTEDWLHRLGGNVPPKIIKACKNKGAK